MPQAMVTDGIKSAGALMLIFISFAVTLFIAVLISGWARKTVLSTSVLFLAAGLFVGSPVFHGVTAPSAAVLSRVAEVALFTVLFSDGMRTGGVQEFARCWQLPGRALMIGMPLTIVGVALVAHWLTGMTWTHAFLFGAALSPTDPVFVSSVFAHENVPKRLKDMLNIESGVNDGLALPVVLVLISSLRSTSAGWLPLVAELAGGAAIGIVLSWVAVKVEATDWFSAVGVFEPLTAFSIALLVMAACYATRTNLFLGAFAAGITVAGTSKEVRSSFQEFGEILAEVFKLLALLLLGIVAAARILQPLTAAEYILILVAVFAVRPVAVPLSLIGSRLTRREIWTAGWFGPKGFASVVYGIMILNVSPHLAHLVGLAVIASIVVYSSTDIFVGRWYPDVKREDVPFRERPAA